MLKLDHITVEVPNAAGAARSELNAPQSECGRAENVLDHRDATIPAR
jgi:hypothetical protein